MAYRAWPWWLRIVWHPRICIEGSESSKFSHVSLDLLCIVRKTFLVLFLPFFGHLFQSKILNTNNLKEGTSSCWFRSIWWVDCFRCGSVSFRIRGWCSSNIHHVDVFSWTISEYLCQEASSEDCKEQTIWCCFARCHHSGLLGSWGIFQWQGFVCMQRWWRMGSTWIICWYVCRNLGKICTVHDFCTCTNFVYIQIYKIYVVCARLKKENHVNVNVDKISGKLVPFRLLKSLSKSCLTWNPMCLQI